MRFENRTNMKTEKMKGKKRIPSVPAVMRTMLAVNS